MTRSAEKNVKPGTLDIEIMQGDTFDDIAVIELPDLSSRGGPSDLTGCTVRAQVRKDQKPTSTLYAEFDVEIIDEVARTIHPTMVPEESALIPRSGYWDLQVEDPSQSPPWIGTVLRGRATLITEVTHVP